MHFKNEKSSTLFMLWRIFSYMDIVITIIGLIAAVITVVTAIVEFISTIISKKK